MRVKGRVKVVTTFDIAFDSNQRCSKAITYLISTLTRVKGRSKMIIHLTSPLIRIKGICKGVTSLTYYLMRIKCGVKAVITFDHTFDTNQRKSKSIFSCSGKCGRSDNPNNTTLRPVNWELYKITGQLARKKQRPVAQSINLKTRRGTFSLNQQSQRMEHWREVVYSQTSRKRPPKM